MLKSLVLDNAV